MLGEVLTCLGDHFVSRATHRRREIGRALAGVFALLLVGGCPAATFAADAGASGDDFYWDAVKDSRTAKPLKMYLENYPVGRHHLEAEERVRELDGPPPSTSTGQSAVAAPPSVEPEPPARTQQLQPSDLAAHAAPEQRGKPMRGTYYARTTATLRDAPSPDAQIVRPVDGRAALHIEWRTDDGNWYRVGGSRGGWVDASTVIDAKAAETEAWLRVVASRQEEGLRRFLAQFPKGAHAGEALAMVTATPRVLRPADPSGAQDRKPVSNDGLQRQSASVKKMASEDAPPAANGVRDLSDSAVVPAKALDHVDASGATVSEPTPEGSSQGATRPPEEGEQVATLHLPHGDLMGRYDAAVGMIGDGQYKAAQEALAALITDFPSNPLMAKFRYRLGDLYFREHDYPRAIDELTLAHDLDPSSPNAPKALLEVALSMGYGGATSEACSRLRTLTKAYRGMVDGLDEQVGNARKDFKCAR
jgi:TolA-binding protein